MHSDSELDRRNGSDLDSRTAGAQRTRIEEARHRQSDEHRTIGRPLTLSKKTSVGRLGELQAAAGAFGAAELTLRRWFNLNAELGAFAKANANDQAGLAMRLGEIFLDEVAARAPRAKPKRAKR